MIDIEKTLAKQDKSILDTKSLSLSIILVKQKVTEERLKEQNLRENKSESS